MDNWFLFLVVVLMSAATGWIWAHVEIATECERQGSFYVNKKDFECRLKAAK